MRQRPARWRGTVKATAGVLLLAWGLAACGRGEPGGPQAPASTAPVASDVPPPVRLVVLIIVDMFKGAMLDRLVPNLGPGGLAPLMRRGMVYRQAHYSYATTYTAPGHATLVTGRQPSEHGIIANEWFNRQADTSVYCVESDAHTARRGHGPPPVADKAVDKLLTATLGDDLVAATAGRARVFAVSLKDRSAILPAGHAGKAFWYESLLGSLVTNAHSYPGGQGGPPRWWRENWDPAVLRARGLPMPAARQRQAAWDLLRPVSEYAACAGGSGGGCPGGPQRTWSPFFTAAGQPQFELPYRPGQPPRGVNGDLYLKSVLSSTPFGDDLVLDLVEDLMVHERLGQSGVPDFLVVSLSATDYVGHTFGPASLEYEDMLLHVDRSVARLLALVERHVGLDQTLLALSSDHGVDEVPAQRQARGAAAGKLPDAIGMEAWAGQRLVKRLGVAESPIRAFRAPGFYLDRQVLQRLGLDPVEVAATLAGELARLPGVARAFTRAELEAPATAAASELEKQVRRSFHPARSGDVIVAQAPHWYLNNTTLSPAMHGSPHPYDTHVPLLLSGPGISTGVVERQVDVARLAGTLAAILGVDGGVARHGEPPLEEALGEPVSPVPSP